MEFVPFIDTRASEERQAICHYPAATADAERAMGQLLSYKVSGR